MNGSSDCPVCGRTTTVVYDPVLDTRMVKCNGCKWSERFRPKATLDSTLPLPEKAATDKSNTGLVLIPWYSIKRIGRIFIEGLRYGKNNWKKGIYDKEWQEERLEHAIDHLIKWKEGDRSEDHLAKIAWFCLVQMELKRLEDTVSPTGTTSSTTA